MQYWFDRGFTLEGTSDPNVYIAKKSGQNGVLHYNDWTGKMDHVGEWFQTPERARIEASDLSVVNV